MNPQHIPTGRLYHDFAHLWPLMSPPEEYAAEAAHWRTLLRESLGPGRFRLLELGAGGGHNLSHLAGEHETTAVDLSNDMLAQCRQLIPGIETQVGDMRTIRLDRVFDAVLIHDAISHMLSEDDLLAAFRTAAAHLRPGGVFITSPERFQDSFQSPETDSATHTDGKTIFTSFEYAWTPAPAANRVETLLTYYIQTADGLRIEHDRLEQGLFPRSTWRRLLSEAGFAAEFHSFTLPSWPHPYELLLARLTTDQTG